MNMLTDSLPETVSVDGRLYSIHTDFRNWVRFEILMLDRTVPMQRKIIEILKLVYVDSLPPTLRDALYAAVVFYSRAEGEKERVEEKKKGKQVYSFAQDDEYIYAAFLAQYGIDLQSVNLHWWQFKAMFTGLNEENKIIKIMEYRSVNLAEIKDKNQKAFYRKMKELYKLPDLRTEVEKERDMIDMISSVF